MLVASLLLKYHGKCQFWPDVDTILLISGQQLMSVLALGL